MLFVIKKKKKQMKFEKLQQYLRRTILLYLVFIYLCNSTVFW